MASSSSDQKKAEIVLLFQKQCIAEIDTAKAVYDLECLEIKESFKFKTQQACRDLKNQELKQLAEKKRIYDAEMVPMKKRLAQKLAEVQQKYHSASLEANPTRYALAEALSSCDVATVEAEAGQKQSTSTKDSHIDDSDESSDESDTSIPAVMPKVTKEARVTKEATTQAKFAPLIVTRKRRASIQSRGSGRQTDDATRSFQQENEGERDHLSDFTFSDSPIRASRKVPKTSKQVPARKPVSSAPPERSGLDKNGDDSKHNLRASQGPRRGTRRGRPQPGTYLINAATFPQYNES
ncbi:hypothetical protein DHEL01_v200816 [Diaporthe helianthi]|uniref:Uncharacterized protein n=1 Tax=Diaporthe helianthi TaxID=158607 RepID=A0A2P5IE89_DIAHE|nr:hypothetical protein DHEL01_v200816 [Diaporthe helianthi]